MTSSADMPGGRKKPLALFLTVLLLGSPALAELSHTDCATEPSFFSVVFTGTYGTYALNPAPGVAGSSPRDMFGIGLGLKSMVDAGQGLYYILGYHLNFEMEGDHLSSLHLDLGVENEALHGEFSLNYPFWRGWLRDRISGDPVPVESRLGYGFGIGYALTERMAVGVKWTTYYGGYEEAGLPYSADLTRIVVYVRGRWN
jgi:hypothetical protein